MSEIIFDETDGIEFDPLFNEISFLLSENDNAIDPLDSEATLQQINWNDVWAKSSRLLAVCKDLRVVMWHIRAGLHTQGVLSLYQGIKLIDEALVNNEKLYPQIPGESVGSSHAAALGWLSLPHSLTEIRSAFLSDDVRVSLEKLCDVGRDGSVVNVLSYSEAVVAIKDANAYFSHYDAPELSALLGSISDALERIENYANLHSEGYLLDSRHIRAFLRKILQQLEPLAQGQITDDISNDVIDDQEDRDAGLAPSQGRDVKIRNRQDVIIMLDNVIDYFKNYEPSHPAPIFIRRTQKMIGMEFEEIVEELMPESMNLLQQFVGK